MGSDSMAEAGTGALYRRFVGPLLSRDDGADAEQLSQVSLQLLGQASLRRHWPLLNTTLAGLGVELQRRDLRLSRPCSAAVSTIRWGWRPGLTRMRWRLVSGICSVSASRRSAP